MVPDAPRLAVPTGGVSASQVDGAESQCEMSEKMAQELASTNSNRCPYTTILFRVIFLFTTRRTFRYPSRFFALRVVSCHTTYITKNACLVSCLSLEDLQPVCLASRAVHFGACTSHPESESNYS